MGSDLTKGYRLSSGSDGLKPAPLKAFGCIMREAWRKAIGTRPE